MADSSSTDSDTVRARFDALKEQWHEAVGFSSNMRLEHPAYEEIIRLGPPVIPLIMEDLARTKAHWFLALQQITGEDPARDAAPGDMAAIARAWLDWGRSRGYIV